MLVFLFFIFGFTNHTGDLRINLQEGWSFEKYPHPGVNQLGLKQHLKLLRAAETAPDDYTKCRLWLKIDYEIYLERYPQYGSLWDEERRHREWRLHIAQNRAAEPTTCLYSVANSKLRDVLNTGQIGEDFYFCGNYTRAPHNAEEKEAKRLIDEMITFAGFGLEKAALNTNSIAAHNQVINLSLDITYYFYNLSNSIKHSKLLKLGLEGFREVIKPDRIRFLDKAVERRDYQSVVNSLPVCERPFNLER